MFWHRYTTSTAGAATLTGCLAPGMLSGGYVNKTHMNVFHGGKRRHGDFFCTVTMHLHSSATCSFCPAAEVMQPGTFAAFSSLTGKAIVRILCSIADTVPLPILNTQLQRDTKVRWLALHRRLHLALGVQGAAPGALDGYLDSILPVMEADLFGEVAEAKEADAFAAKYRCNRTTTSVALDCHCLLQQVSVHVHSLMQLNTGHWQTLLV